MTVHLVRGRVVTPAGVIEDGMVAVQGDLIHAVGPAVQVLATIGHDPSTAPPASHRVILPGLVDTHCHGGGGASFTQGDADQTRLAADHHRRQGTTTLFASLVTDSPERMLAATETAADAAERGEVAGIHLEGPFLAAACCGAQDPRHLRAPDLGLVRNLLGAGRGHVRSMTLAPELPGAGEVIAELLENGVVPAVGHTQADAGRVEQVLTASGRGLVTHLFNGMPPLHHRRPGPVAGALSAAARGRARVELIADGVHLAHETVRMLFALLGGDRVVLVTDAMAAAGMPDGDYRLGPLEVTVAAGTARLREGDSIAGGTARMLDVVRHCVHGGLDLVEVVASASVVPATAYGLEDRVGALRPGLRADLCVVDEGLRPLQVMAAGAWLT